MAKVYDLEKEEYVEVVIPEEKKEEEEKPVSKKTEEEEYEEEEEETETPGEKETKSEKEKESEEGESEEEEDEKEEESEEEKSEDKELEDVDSFIKEQFEEEYGIKNKEEFLEILDNATELLDENEKLKAELEEVKKATNEPVFKSESQKKVFEALKDYDPERIPDGLHMLAGLVAMDVDKTDPKLILEQEYIMLHPELPIERARKKFQVKYSEKYSIKNEGELTAEELKEKQEDIDSDIEIDAAKAKKFIKEKQEEYKLKSQSKEEEKPKVSEEIQKSIAENTKEFTKHIDGLTTLTWEVDDSGKEKFNYKFSKEQLSKIKNVVETHLKSPASYDAKGNLIGGFDAEEKFQQAAHIIAGPSIVEEALKFAQKHAQIIKAEDIAKKKPNRKAKSSGDLKPMDIDSQAERLAKQRVQAKR